MSSSSSTCASRSASTVPSGCGTSSFSKARTTCTSASTPRSAGRSTSAALSPLAVPGTSTYSTVAGVVLRGENMRASASTRASGTRATPTRASARPAAGAAPVRSWNSVLLPASGSPTNPAFTLHPPRGRLCYARRQPCAPWPLV
jgi:hypothetical protein